MREVVVDDFSTQKQQHIALDIDTGGYYYNKPDKNTEEVGIAAETSAGLVSLFVYNGRLFFYRKDLIPIGEDDSVYCINEVVDAGFRKMNLIINGEKVDSYEYERFQMIAPAIDAEEDEEDHDISLYICQLLQDKSVRENLQKVWGGH